MPRSRCRGSLAFSPPWDKVATAEGGSRLAVKEPNLPLIRPSGTFSHGGEKALTAAIEARAAPGHCP
jgi:hypothetical protein